MHIFLCRLKRGSRAACHHSGHRQYLCCCCLICVWLVACLFDPTVPLLSGAFIHLRNLVLSIEMVFSERVLVACLTAHNADICAILSKDQFEAQLPKIIQMILSMLKSEKEHLPILQVLLLLLLLLFIIIYYSFYFYDYIYNSVA